MAAGTRRYSIELIVNTQQLTQAGQEADKVQQQVKQGATGAASAIEGAATSVTRYLLGIQGLRAAWSMASQEMQKYMDMKSKMDEQQKTAAEKSLDYQRMLRQHFKNEGGFEHPEKLPAIRKDAEEFIKSVGFHSDAQGAKFLTTFSSDVAQYIGDPGEKGKLGLISNAEGAKYRKHVAASSVLGGVDAENANKVAGAILGSTNWNKYGNKAGMTAAAQYERSMGIMSRGRGDINVNARNYARLVNEMVQVDREEGRLTGDDALDKAAILIREVSEYNPEESEVFVRNWAEASRMLNKKGTKEQWKKAGMAYDDPADAARKALVYFKKLKAAGKIPQGKTFIDWLRNDANVAIRGGAGGQAIASAEAKGMGKAALEGVADINADTVQGKLASAIQNDEAYQADQAARQQSASERSIGDMTASIDKARKLGMAIAMAKGFHGDYDPRSYADKGNFRRLNPQGGFGLFAGEYDDEKHKGDMELYRELAARNHPGVDPEEAKRSRNPASLADTMTRKFYLSDPSARTRMINEEFQLYESRGQKVVELLEKILKEAEAQRAQNPPVVPNNGQRGGMVPPG